MANFYNTIDTQIVRSQKPLLLDFALQFEQLATNPRAKSASGASGGKLITWSDPTQLEAYIEQLHASAERLTQENRKLRGVHTHIGEQVRRSQQPAPAHAPAHALALIPRPKPSLHLHPHPPTPPPQVP